MEHTSAYDSIEQARKRMGSSLCIVGHHYQTEEVIRHTDIRGDSLELARKVAAVDADHIVFCGVYFMGESAALLARPGQKVHLPDPSAECSMALMADAPALEAALEALGKSGRKIIPLAYVNSTLAVKAVVGKFGGAVCTSANARVMLEWAFSQSDAVLFLPDMNLGINTANAMGLPEIERYLLDLGQDNNDASRINLSMAEKSKLLLWPGYCSIHTHFTPEMVRDMRALRPGAKVVVHPESPPEVVAEADAAGSTSFIIKYVQDAPEGSTVVIGTEVNLVQRLAEQYAGKVTVLPLSVSSCEFMAQVTEERLAAALKAVEAGSDEFAVHVEESLKEPARLALERMLAACA